MRKISNLTNMFQMGGNHPLEKDGTKKTFKNMLKLPEVCTAYPQRGEQECISSAGPGLEKRVIHVANAVKGLPSTL